MNAPRIGLTPDQFEALFPFHIACDPFLRVTHVGATLSRLCADLLPGTPLGDWFEISRPTIPMEPEQVRSSEGTLFILKSLRSTLRLRAQVLVLDEAGSLVFLGSPWIGDPSELAPLGLSLTDFALHDATPDMLQLVMATNSALGDTQALADKLARQRVALREANEALTQTEARFRGLSEQSPLGVLTMDRRGNVTFVNDRLVRAIAGRPENVLGQAWRHLFPDGAADLALEQIWNREAGTGPINVELPLQRPDGTTGWVSITGTTWTTPSGAAELLCVAEDITSRKDAEAAIARTKARESEIASRVQETLLHGHAPTAFPGLKIGEFMASKHEVNGDFYEFFVQSDTVVDVLLGDAMGKGLPAALQGAATKARFSRAIARLIYEGGGVIPEPVTIVARVQRSLGPQFMAMDTFTTLMYLRFDFASRTMRWVGCGHPGILYRPAAGGFRTLNGDNAPLGFSSSQVFLEEQIGFDPGDLFVLYSDGLTETTSPDGEPFGVNRLVTLVESQGDAEAEVITRAIHEAVEQFAGPAGHRDDISCLVIRTGEDPLGPECVGHDFEATEGALSGIRTFCSHFLRAAVPTQAPAEWQEQLLLATHEAATNILKHGMVDRAGRPTISVAVGSTVAGVQVMLTYDGRPFQPAAPAVVPDLDGYPEHGFGLALMQSSVDRVDHATTPTGRQTITLTKYFTAPKAG
jgi:sigma-B regulation protein RsbU (phosphoserine phosphatase)